MRQIIPFFLTIVLTPILAGIINSLLVRIIFLFIRKKIKNEVPIKTLFADSKLAFIFLLPLSYVLCFYCFSYFLSGINSTFFQPAKKELLFIMGVMWCLSLISHLLFSERIRLFKNKAILERICLVRKEIEWSQVISIKKKSAFLFTRVKSLVFMMKDNSIIETRIPEYYLEIINSIKNHL